MSLGRPRCALALLWIAGCSFPDYNLPDSLTGTAGTGATSGTSSCSNGVRDGNEVGIDCGPSCQPCMGCSDGMQNGSETGVDCGGDCTTCPSCDDETQNGLESDRDCGGMCSTRCATNQRCHENADCKSLVCASVCQPSDCNDEVRNGPETGVDCGGGGCAACGNGSACLADSDCTSLRCQSNVCVSAGCTDGIVNGKESDLDCGGDDCAPCDTAKTCKKSADCASRVCDATLCAAATCSDSTHNQDESDVDCGGLGCTPCQISEACVKASDCESALCQSGMCVPLNPSGQPLSKASWTISTSESDTEMGTEQALDEDTSTCWTSGKTQYAGMYVELDLGQPRYFFKALMRVNVSPYEQDFPDSLDVYVSKDGSFGEPVQSSIMGSQWTWVDFPSAQVGRYVRLVLAKDKAQNWSIGDITLYN